MQASNEKTKCKVGLTGDLDERLNTYNKKEPGKSADATCQYLFACEVSDMRQVERDFLEEFRRLREQPRTEMMFYNSELFGDYVKFIKEHPMFIKEIPIIEDENVKKIVEIKYSKKTSPPLKDRGMTTIDVINKAKRIKDDEFYTRYEDIEKEISMYDKSI